MAIMATKGNQGLGKWENSATMVRLVRELIHRLEDTGEITAEEIVQIDDKVLIPFLRDLPKKVQDDLLHG